MSGKMLGIPILAMVMSLVSNSMAAELWWGGEGLWSSGGNWNTGAVPTEVDQAGINAGTCLIDETVDAVCYEMRGPGWTTNEATLNITGGSLTVTLTAVGQYVLMLEASDGELTGMDLVTINAFIDSCDAAQSLPDYEPFPGDLNGDCIVNELDMAIWEEDWLKCNALDCNDVGL